MLVLPFTAVHGCVLLSTGVDEVFCLDGSAGAGQCCKSQGAGLQQHYIFSRNFFTLWPYTKSVLERIATCKIIMYRQTSCFILSVLSVLLSHVLAFSCSPQYIVK